MKTTICKLALALAASAGLNAHAGVLTWQDVVFTTRWADNVLTLEIDAAKHSGDWTAATRLSALGIKDIGRFDSVLVTAAPKGVDAWTLNSRELNRNGCSGGGGSVAANKELCLSGAPILLTDDMVFTFTFAGAPVLAEPHLKVRFADNANAKVGDLLSQKIKASAVAVPGPVMPPPPADPDTPVIVPPPTTPVQEPLPPVVLVPVDQEAGAGGEVPEPHTFVLLLAGLVLMGAALRKRG